MLGGEDLRFINWFINSKPGTSFRSAGVSRAESNDWALQARPRAPVSEPARGLTLTGKLYCLGVKFKLLHACQLGSIKKLLRGADLVDPHNLLVGVFVDGVPGVHVLGVRWLCSLLEASELAMEEAGFRVKHS